MEKETGSALSLFLSGCVQLLLSTPHVLHVELLGYKVVETQEVQVASLLSGFNRAQAWGRRVQHLRHTQVVVCGRIKKYTACSTNRGCTIFTRTSFFYNHHLCVVVLVGFSNLAVHHTLARHTTHPCFLFHNTPSQRHHSLLGNMHPQPRAVCLISCVCAGAGGLLHIQGGNSAGSSHKG